MRILVLDGYSITANELGYEDGGTRVLHEGNLSKIIVKYLNIRIDPLFFFEFDDHFLIA